MALTSNEMSPADFAAVTRGNNDGFGFADNGAWWIIILFLFAFMGNGWGNNAGNGGATPYMTQVNTGNELQRGFDQASVMSSLGDISVGMTNGFAGVNQALCNGFANVEIGANARQMADMQQGFASQTAIMQQLNNMAMTQQNCCCENRAAVADLKYTIATEACADRAAVQQGVQTIIDKMCQQELDAERRENANLRQQINMMSIASTADAKAAQIMADNAAQTQALEQYLNPVPIPAYQVANPNCCNGNNFGGCGNF